MENIDIDVEVNIELDVPDERDYQYDELFGSAWEPTNKIVEFLPREIQNQWIDPLTKMACSRFGIVHAINAQNYAVSKIDGMRFFEISWKWMWENYLKTIPNAITDGATLQSALNQMLDVKYITGYSCIKLANQKADEAVINSMKHSLDNTRPIYTGSKLCDWKSVRDFHKYALWTGYAHIFCIVWYNESSWIAINSYGANNGVFYIPFELTGSLFSCYSLSDSRDDEVFYKLK